MRIVSFREFISESNILFSSRQQLTKQRKQRKEGIAMNVKGIQPLHRLPDMRRALHNSQMPVGDLPQNRRHNHSTHKPIPKDGMNQKRQGSSERYPKGHTVGNAGNKQKRSLQAHKGRVIPGPMVLGLFSIVCRLVYGLWAARNQGAHLI